MLNTILIILEQSLLHIPLIVGAYISISLLQVPDLGIESAYVFGALMGSLTVRFLSNSPLITVQSGYVLGLAVIAAIAGGFFVGAIAGIITKKGKLPHLLSSIITLGLFHGINQYISPVYVSLVGCVNPLACGNFIPYHPELLMLILIVVIVVSFIFLLLQAQIGYAYQVYGNNPQFFDHYNISSSYVFVSGIILSHGLAGLSGYLFAQTNTFVELNMASGKVLLCITALILGKTIVSNKIRSSLSIPLVGTALYFTIQQSLLQCGFNLKYFTFVQAFLVLVLLVYTYRNKSHQMIHDNLGV